MQSAPQLFSCNYCNKVKYKIDVPPHNSQQKHHDYHQGVGTWQKSSQSPQGILFGHEREAEINIAK